jgi:hypothetical protein
VWKTADDNGELHYGNYNCEIVHCGDGTDLSDLPWGSEIHIRGHGAPGLHEIANDDAASVFLKYDDLADRLLSHGLKKTWVGVVKCYMGPMDSTPNSQGGETYKHKHATLFGKEIKSKWAKVFF